MTEIESPKIEFPCPNYPIKVVGDSVPHFRAFVEGVMAKFDPQFETQHTHVRLSSKGHYLAVNVMVTATGVEQLGKIFVELKANPAVRIVL
jgi:uncharacterized protein